MNRINLILGAGITGLSASYLSDMKVYEASDYPGGICSSYYIEPGNTERLLYNSQKKEAYRFDIGGGHWIFGNDEESINFIRKFVSLKQYSRRSSVFFKDEDLYIPYPIQNHLRYFNKEISSRCLSEINNPTGAFSTMKEWMEKHFGASLCELFFFPFHALYTAGLYKTIAPQDVYKSPVDKSIVIQGAKEEVTSVGYNINFVYPKEGLNVLAKKIADKCDINFNAKAYKIDTQKKKVYFKDGSIVPYKKIISTLPLNTMIEMAGIKINEKHDPYTSVLVLNIGAVKGGKCPDDHWIYIPRSKSGFHRIGFYSNVDKSFLPKSSRKDNKKVSIYVEKAYTGGMKPSNVKISKYIKEAIKEVQEMDFVSKIEAVDTNWIDVAYTWSWPGSTWREKALEELKKRDIFQVGRYGKWKFQGIADSIRDGMNIGKALKGN